MMHACRKSGKCIQLFTEDWARWKKFLGEMDCNLKLVFVWELYAKQSLIFDWNRG